MRKERIKSVILVLLILNCLQFTGQMWFNEKLWPSGYNFFDYAKNAPIVSALFPSINDRGGTAVVMPVRAKKIVVNGGNAREVYLPGQRQYYTAYAAAEKVLKAMLKSAPRSSPALPEDWEKHLTYKSIYLDFGFITFQYFNFEFALTGILPFIGSSQLML